MTDQQTGQDAPVEANPLKIMLALAAAMCIGRFAFTPLLHIMLSDGVIDLAGASWLASANYFGYLVGALLYTFQPLIWRRFSGLALHLPVLRFLAGVASAFVFVFNSGWVVFGVLAC